MNISEYQNYQERKRHTAAAFPYNTYLCSIPLDFTHVPLHWHAELELIVIKKGRFRVRRLKPQPGLRGRPRIYPPGTATLHRPAGGLFHGVRKYHF